MTPPSPPQPPAPEPPRRRWWLWVMLLLLLAGIAALGWNAFTWQRAVRQLREAGISANSQQEWLGARLWRIARADWRRLFYAGIWQAKPIRWRIHPAKAGQLRNLDALAPALRRIDLQVLDLSGCPALQNVDGLRGLTALRELDLSECPALQNMGGLKSLATVEKLSLSECPSLENVDWIKGFTGLRILDLSGCLALQNVDGLKELPALQWVCLSECAALQNVDALKGLGLQTLDLRGCTKLGPEAELRAALRAGYLEYP